MQADSLPAELPGKPRLGRVGLKAQPKLGVRKNRVKAKNKKIILLHLQEQGPRLESMQGLGSFLWHPSPSWRSRTHRSPQHQQKGTNSRVPGQGRQFNALHLITISHCPPGGSLPQGTPHTGAPDSVHKSRPTISPTSHSNPCPGLGGLVFSPVGPRSRQKRALLREMSHSKKEG